MMGRKPKYYIPSFVEIDPPIPEKKIFEGFLRYKGMAAILCHVTSTILIIFTYMYLKAFIQNLVKSGPVVSEKSTFFHM